MDKEKCVLAEVEGSRASLKNLNSRLRRLDADALKQQELIYNQVKLIYNQVKCQHTFLF